MKAPRIKTATIKLTFAEQADAGEDARINALKESLRYFMRSLELVLDIDWPVSASRIGDPCFIAPRGTFLWPGVEDEDSNWANRGALLSAFRDLKARMRDLGMDE